MVQRAKIGVGRVQIDGLDHDYECVWLALRTRRHNCTAIGPALLSLCMCSESVHLYPAAYNVRMQMVNKSLINQVLSTRILSDTLKFDKVMIRVD